MYLGQCCLCMGKRGFHPRPDVNTQAPNVSMPLWPTKHALICLFFSKKYHYYVKPVCIYLANGKEDPKKCKAEILESHKADTQ